MFSNKELQDLIARKAVGNRFPYDTENQQEIDAHIRRFFYRLNRIPNLICEAEWNHFGSGYASFVEIFCYIKEGLIVEEKYGMREENIEGIIIDICRLAPVAIMGMDERFHKIRIETNEKVSGASGCLLDGPHRLYVNEKYQEVADKIGFALQEFDIELLSAATLNELLPFRAKIDTIHRNPNDYLIMDAIFYWED